MIPNPDDKTRKTPGVYITEFPAFPPSVVGVQTAVPAFIGYTEKAIVDGKSVMFEPVPIGSMADFEQVFGTDANAIYSIQPASESAEFMAGGQGFVIDAGQRPRFNLYRSMRLFYANGGGQCYVVSVGDFSDAVSLAPLQKGLEAIAGQAGPTMLVVPDAVLLPPDGAQTSPVPTSTDFNTLTALMLEQCVELRDRVAIFDVYGATAVTQTNANQTLEPCIRQFQGAIQSGSPSYGMAYFPFLNTTIVPASAINYTNFDLGQPPQSPLSPAAPTQIQYILTLWNQQQYPSESQPNPTQQKVQTYIDQISPSDQQQHDSPAVISLNRTLADALPAYAQLLDLIAARAGVLPPSGAMAGLYTQNDQTRGVWNAPADLPVECAVSLTVNLDDQQQAGLNAPADGKAVNAIRSFPGRGPTVWGARTLDGNNPDYRYVPVRRTLIYIEQSIQNGLKQFVFAPNDARTWAAVTQTISGFLYGLWSQGGLLGAKPSEAYTVSCGVPQTMTATDVLDGVMLVQVSLQMVHPAEFIVLMFRQQMQGA